MDNQELKGRVSLVTGASRGLGKAIAIRLASLGSKVAINYVARDEEAAAVAKEIESKGGEAIVIKANVADADAVKPMIRQITDKCGRIDILVNNAGIVKDSLLLRMPDEAWDDVINTNLRGAYLCTKFAMRSMMENSWGRIINISSLAGLLGNAGQANYSAAKGGLIAFTKAVAREAGARNITSNVICPGFITTDMTDKLPQEAKSMILSRIALKRFGTPQDVAELVAFLASERAGYITGQVICIDGGVV
ncbi:MAG: 3-oxoacyl-[acyl-carrier-protein] reductase [Dehalococcoidia bacterium]|nr:3-oxoacyl-[acyl-carrier-protein] reductase [Dehalococcoidia bacterium]